MKAMRKSPNTTQIVICAGLVGIALRFALYRLGYDDRGLMDNYHPLHAACLVLSAAVAVFVALAVRHMGDSNRYEDNFPADSRGILSVCATALWFLAGAFAAKDDSIDRIGTVWRVLYFLSVPCFAVTGYCRMKGKRPTFLLHGLLCLFFAVNMVSCYRRWSGNPQLPDYVFQLFACALLTLTAYYRAAFDADMGSRRKLLLCSNLAAFFCMLSLIGPDDTYLYWGGLLWTVTGLCVPRIPTRTPDPEPREDS